MTWRFGESKGTICLSFGKAEAWQKCAKILLFSVFLALGAAVMVSFQRKVVLLDNTKSNVYHGLLMPFWLYVDRSCEIPGGDIFFMGGGEIKCSMLWLAWNCTILKDELSHLSITESHQRNVPGELWRCSGVTSFLCLQIVFKRCTNN